MYRDAALVAGETYHVYNRGAHKQEIFKDERDYRRFLALLYLANSSSPVHVGNTFKKYGGLFSFQFKEEGVDRALVGIHAYSLMPNHFHIVLQPKTDHGLPVFMKKLSTAYSMYFNKRYEHSGVVFQGPYKSRHVNNEAYFRYIFSYVHLNPISLTIPDWETEGLGNLELVRNFFNKYPYSSYFDYSVQARAEREILAFQDAPPFLKEMNDLEELLKWYKNEDSPRYFGGDKGKGGHGVVLESRG